MRTLFDETRINGMTLKNRLVRSATWEGMGDPAGRATERLAALYGDLARGGVGLIVTGYAHVAPEGQQLPGQLAVCDDSGLEELKLLPRAVTPHGGKICLQLVHCGGQANRKSSGLPPVAPSAVAVVQYPEQPEELTPAAIEQLIQQFGAAAALARAAGFHAVQLHAAHGYLINQFLSPLTNRRSDAWGGTIDNRCRFLLAVYRSVRSAVGSDFPVLAKLNGDDFLPGGLTADDALQAARLLDSEGIDAIEVSGGTPASEDRTPVRQHIDSRRDEAYNLPLAARIKAAVHCPVMVVGGMRSFEVTAGIVRRGEADYVALSRPFIREPHLALRWQSGDESRARCISCNGCFKPGLKGKGIACVVERIERESDGLSL